VTPDAASPWGLLAEFEEPEALVRAAARVREAGYRRVDAFSPYPIEELGEALGLRPSPLPLVVLIGGLLGGLGGFALQAWSSVVAYPMNVGGRPAFSWPAFVVPAFETTILGAALAAVLGMFAFGRLPMPYHPLFHVPRFALASRDRYFLCIEAADPLFDARRTRRLLEELSPTGVHDVPA